MALIEVFGFPSFLAMTITVNGAALIGQGRYEEGIAEMHQGLATFSSTGGMPFATFWYHLAYGLGRIRTAPGRTSSGGGRISFRAKTREQLSIPSLHHVKGELLLAQNPSDVAEAERCFRTAIEIARRQGARSAELRATMSLARLLAKQDRRDEARAMLAEIYNWFTEGFDTADLRDAKALLDELNE